MDAESNDEELLEGTMLKRGGMFMGWRERHFVLSTSKLSYFTHPSKGTPKGTILLDSIKCIESLPDKKLGKRFCMAIVSPSVTWIVRSDTEADFQRWQDAIRAAVESLRKIQSQPMDLLASPTANSSARTPMASKDEQPSKVQTPSAQTPSAHQRDGNQQRAGTLPSPSSFSSSTSNITSKVQRNSESFKNSSSRKITDYYILGRVIDSGSNGKVLEGTERKTGLRVAIKQVEMGHVTEKEDQMDIWQQVQHEHVVRLIDFFKDVAAGCLYFVMELATGRDLFYGVMQHYEGDIPRGFSEADARDLTHQVLTALRHLHLRRIVHCDLKPENILLHTTDGKPRIKLADWGFAQAKKSSIPSLFLNLPFKVLSSSRPLDRVLGTGGYMAPEILAGQTYGEKVDMWSAGVIFYVLLCGFPPYEAVYAPNGPLDRQATLRAVTRQAPGGVWTYFPSPYWDAVSREGRAFVQSLLTIDPAARSSAEKALQHEWYSALPKNSRGPQNPVWPALSVLEQMRKYNASRARLPQIF